MPTEAQIQLYENKIALRGQRRQARRPAVIAFRNLFGLMFLGAAIYGVTAIWVGAGNDNGPNDGGPLWEDPMDFYILFGYIAFVALILVVKHSDGHKIRTIARARRSALYEGHPWAQYRIEHPYMSHVVVIGAMLTVLNLLSGKRR